MNITSYKIVIQYRGTAYLGWQIQEKQGKTIQGEINRVLSILCKTRSDQIYTYGSGRTDAGVHALGQVVRADLPIAIPEKGLLLGMNSLLPADIKVISIVPCAHTFRPINDALWKEYIYFFCNERFLSPFVTDLVTGYDYRLDEALMKQACNLFVGEHNFNQFYCTGTPVNTTIRTIYECELIKEQSSGIYANFIPEYYVFRVRGSGFLKQMVRLMMGTIWNIGQGRTSLEQLQNALQGQGTNKLGQVAPPQGLYLKEVCYSFT